MRCINQRMFILYFLFIQIKNACSTVRRNRRIKTKRKTNFKQVSLKAFRHLCIFTDILYKRFSKPNNFLNSVKFLLKKDYFYFLSSK